MLWGLSWALLGALGALFARSWGAIQVWETLSHTSKRSGRLLDAILSRFSLDFERFGSDLSSIFRGFSCFLLLSLAVSCFLLLSLACCCLLLLPLAFSCFLVIHQDSSCAFRSIATQVLPLSWVLFSLFSLFLPFQVAFKILHRKNCEKSAKIEDFGLPKPSQNPPKTLPKSRPQKTCKFWELLDNFF